MDDVKSIGTLAFNRAMKHFRGDPLLIDILKLLEARMSGLEMGYIDNDHRIAVLEVKEEIAAAKVDKAVRDEQK